MSLLNTYLTGKLFLLNGVELSIYAHFLDCELIAMRILKRGMKETFLREEFVNLIEDIFS